MKDANRDGWEIGGGYKLIYPVMFGKNWEVQFVKYPDYGVKAFADYIADIRDGKIKQHMDWDKLNRLIELIERVLLLNDTYKLYYYGTLFYHYIEDAQDLKLAKIIRKKQAKYVKEIVKIVKEV